MIIFGIGLQRTGTTSLTQALEAIGYNTCHTCLNALEIRQGQLRYKQQVIERYDAVTDIPTQLFYKELEREFPNAKFILTTRNFEKWKESVKEQFSPLRALLRERIRGPELVRYLEGLYGTQVYDSKRFEETFQQYHDEVRAYFAGKKEKILEIDISEQDKLQKICGFLGKETPNISFPHANKGKSTIKEIILSTSFGERFGLRTK